MYLRAIHTERDLQILHQFIKTNPLGVLITAIPTSGYSTIQCSHLPWVLDVGDGTKPTVLRSHLARANQQSKILIDAAQQAHPQRQLEFEVSVMFNGPVQSYLTPKFYTETKPSTGKVVPTWNYSAVQAYGRMTVFYDSKSEETGAFLAQQLDDITKLGEEQVMGFTGNSKPTAWKVSDAPASYTEMLKKAIIGVEIEVDRLEGKFKMSQEQREGDRQGVIDGFAGMGSEDAKLMASTIKDRGEMAKRTPSTVKAA